MNAIVALLACATLASGEWVESQMGRVTTLIGLDSNRASNVYGAAGNNANGAVGIYYSEDGGKNGRWNSPVGNLNLDVAVNTDGVAALVCIGSLLVAKDGKTFEKSTMWATSQDINTFGKSSFGAAGSFTPLSDGKPGKQVCGVAISTDSGSSWDAYDIGGNCTSNPARYAAYPSDNTWFVSTGTWPSDDAEEKSEHHHITHRISLSQDGKPYFRTRAPTVTAGAIYQGGISKTTDGGETWTQVYSTEQNYFNTIHCASENVCIAVMSNAQDAKALMTTDGGETWAVTLTETEGMDLMAVHMVTEKEAWVGGGGGTTGHYWHTVDQGATWDMSTVQGNIAMDFAFTSDGSVGYAACINKLDCGIVRYDA